jgi:DNA-binding NtrC family response regulator
VARCTSGAGTPLAVARVVTTVLLVDDDAGVRFALTEVLRDRGYCVIPVSSGAQALASLQGVDVVVTDFSMPGMDGLELTTRIGRCAPGLPVILLTAHGSEHLVQIASRHGACGCLSKPFDIDEIGRVIEHARTLRPPTGAASAGLIGDCRRRNPGASAR